MDPAVGGTVDARQSSAVVAAANILRWVAWLFILVPIVLVILPGGIILLVFGAPLVLGPIALGIVELRLAKALRAGHRRAAVAVTTLVQGVALVVLSIQVSMADSQDGDSFLLVISFLFFLLGALSAMVAFLAAWGGGRGARERDRERRLELEPALWPWILVAVLLGLLSLLGIAVESGP